MQDYKLETAGRGGYFFACVVATCISRDLVDRLLTEVNSPLRFSRTGRLLFEWRIDDLSCDAHIFLLMRELIKVMPGVKVAFLNSNDAQQDAMAFAATIGQQQAEEHHYFAHAASAEKWLVGFDWMEAHLQGAITKPLTPSIEELSEAYERKVARAKDLIQHLERIRPSIEHDTTQFIRWEAEKAAAEKSLYDVDATHAAQLRRAG